VLRGLRAAAAAGTTAAGRTAAAAATTTAAGRTATVSGRRRRLGRICEGEPRVIGDAGDADTDRNRRRSGDTDL
jgi:hypothetical protein